MTSVTEAEIEALQAKRHWPWPLALAYVQPLRFSAVAKASEALIVYREQDGPAPQYTASAAVQLIYSAVNSGPLPPEPVLGTDSTGEPYTITSGEQIYWEAVSDLEADLLGALEAGQIQALGRKTAAGDLEPIPETAWVRGEVKPEATSDLVEQGWRRAGSLSNILGEKSFAVRYYDIHFIGDDVRQYAEALKRSRNARLSEEMFGERFAEIESLEDQGLSLEMGYWSLLVAGAWVSSRSSAFTAAVQAFEKDKDCERGHGGFVYTAVSDCMGRRGWPLLSVAFGDLALALQSGVVPGSSGTEGRFGGIRIIERHEWRGFRGPIHERDGVSPLPGIYNVGLPAEEVLAAFPVNGSASIAPPTNADLGNRAKPMGRSRGSGGYAAKDRELFPLMRKALEERQATSVWRAAELIADMADGVEENKPRRLTEGFKRANPDWESLIA